MCVCVCMCICRNRDRCMEKQTKYVICNPRILPRRDPAEQTPTLPHPGPVFTNLAVKSHTSQDLWGKSDCAAKSVHNGIMDIGKVSAVFTKLQWRWQALACKWQSSATMPVEPGFRTLFSCRRRRFRDDLGGSSSDPPIHPSRIWGEFIGEPVKLKKIENTLPGRLTQSETFCLNLCTN